VARQVDAPEDRTSGFNAHNRYHLIHSPDVVVR
jgi:hypothetical protein